MAGIFASGFALGVGAAILGWICCGGSRLDPPSDWLGSEADAMAVCPPVDAADDERRALEGRVLQLRRDLQRRRARVLRFSRGGNEAA